MLVWKLAPLRKDGFRKPGRSPINANVPVWAGELREILRIIMELSVTTSLFLNLAHVSNDEMSFLFHGGLQIV